MLKTFRKKGLQKKILWVIAIVIIISFGFFGTASLLNNRRSISDAGTIFGKEISFPQFERAYRDVRLQALLRHGDKFNEYINMVDLNAETWDRLILLHEANRRRLKVSDKEVVATIQGYPFFQRDGVFDDLLYQDVAQYVFKVRARDFEEAIRDSLLINRLYAQETFSVTILEDDVLQIFQKQNEKVQVSYIFVSPQQFKDAANFNEDEARTYFEENKYTFTLPASINVEYVRIPFSADDPATPEDESEVSKKESGELAEKLFQDLGNHPDFKTAAEAHKLELHTSGFFSMENPKLDMGMSYELLKRLFDMQVEVITEPKETSDAFFLAKVVERKEASLPAYEEAKEKVKEAILLEKAMVVAKSKAQEMLEALKKQYDSVLPHNFGDAAKALGLEPAQTPEFNRGQYLPQIGIQKDFQEAAFGLSEDKPISDVVPTELGYYMIHLDQYVPADHQDFELQKDEIGQILLLKKRNEAFSEYLSGLRLKANLNDNISTQKASQ